MANKIPAVLFVLFPLAIWTFFGRLEKSKGDGRWGTGDGDDGRRKEEGGGNKNQPLYPLQTNPVQLPTSPIIHPSSFILHSYSPFPSRSSLRAARAVTVFLLAAALGCGLWSGRTEQLRRAIPRIRSFTVCSAARRGTPTRIGSGTWPIVAINFPRNLLSQNMDYLFLTTDLLKSALDSAGDFGLTPNASKRRLRWGLLAYLVFFSPDGGC